MWFLIVLIVLAVAVGLAWAYFNFTQIKNVPIGTNLTL
jgi:H+-translocating diphosphatase